MTEATKYDPVPDEEAEPEEALEVDEEALIFNLLHKSEDDRLVKRTPKEEIVQSAARALIFEYGFDLTELERAFPIKLTTVSQATGRLQSRNVKLDIAVFVNRNGGGSRTQAEIIRAGVIVAPATRADDDTRGVSFLDDILGALEACQFGFWTNGTEVAYRRKVMEDSTPRYEDVGEMPAAGETFESLLNQRGRHRLIVQTADTLAQTFRRCHDYLHGNQGLKKGVAFWEFLRLIFCKMYDEQREAVGRERRFWIGLTERFTAPGQKAIKERLTELFEEVKGNGSVPSDYAHLFRQDESIGLFDPALAYVAGELSRYDLLNSSEDAKGAAYEELIDKKQKGENGQFFTPRNVIRLMVSMLDPDESDYVLDPACGTGGFVVMVFRHVRQKIENRLRSTWADPGRPTAAELKHLHQTAKLWAEQHIWGFDFDRDLVKATQMNLAMNDGAGRIYCVDSLKYPLGETVDLPRLLRDVGQEGYSTGEKPIGELGSFTLCFTNPPFGSKIPFTDRKALLEFDLARGEPPKGSFNYKDDKRRATRKRSVAPETLFVERCVQWVRPGGRVGIVLPDGILGNPKDVYIRRWILDHCDVLASIDLPVETFLPQVGVQPSLLFLKKKTDEDLDAEAMGTRPDRKVFMAIVDHVGKDRRGNVIYKRNPDGTDLPPVVRRERRTALRDGKQIIVEIPIEEPVVDDDLPDILLAWHYSRQIERA